MAEAGDFPHSIEHRNAEGIPDRTVIILGVMAATLAAIGDLTELVEAASLAFLFTFAVVCSLAFKARAGSRWFTGFGALAASAATIALIIRLLMTDLFALVALAVLTLVAVFGRKFILRHSS